MRSTQRRVLMKTFMESQFGCFPLVRMFHGRAVNRKISHLHERSPRIVYKDYTSSFEDLDKISLSLLITGTVSHSL